MEIFSINLRARLRPKHEALQRLRSGPVPTLLQNFSVSDGGQAFVGVLNQNALDKADATKSQLLVTDQSPHGDANSWAGRPGGSDRTAL